MPSRSQYALMSSKDRNAVLFICFSSAVAFFDFLIYLYLADIIAAAFFLLIPVRRWQKYKGLGYLRLGIWHVRLAGLSLGALVISVDENRYY